MISFCGFRLRFFLMVLSLDFVTYFLRVFKLSQILSQIVGFIQRFDALGRRFVPRVGIAVHGDGGLAAEGC